MKRIQVGPVDVAVDQAGSGDPLILIHPASLSRVVWERNLKALAERFTTFAVDMPGHGDSGVAPGWKPDMMWFCEKLCRQLGIASAG